MLEKRENFLESKIEKEVTEAKKKMAAKDKKGALMCLKRKKAYEAQRDKLSGARMNIESQVMALEGASVTSETIKAMKTGAQAMKSLNQNMKVEDVDTVVDDIREQMDVQNEITDAISQPLGDIIDEDELLSELEGLEQEEIDAQLLNIPSTGITAKMPSAPTKTPTVKSKVDEDKELAALEAAMG